MHLKRQSLSRRMPVPRKGTKMVVGSLINPSNSVPLVIAIRDMLKIARTAKEVQKMIHQGLLKVNWRKAKDYREQINLFNILEADKKYYLSILSTGKFTLKETKSEDRLCKVTGKRLVRNGKIQINLHDGTNFITDKKINMGDSVYLDNQLKIKKIISLEKGSEVFIISGKYAGSEGKVVSVDGEKYEVNLKEKDNNSVLKREVLIAI